MAYNKKTGNSSQRGGKKMVEDTISLFEDYKQRKETWSKQAKEDKEFRLGKQWSDEQTSVLEARGQAPIVVNRIHPAVETAKAMITAIDQPLEHPHEKIQTEESPM